MPCVHEFGIIDNLKDYNEREYEPKKYNCIAVDDDLLDEIIKLDLKSELSKLETFAHNTNRPYKDLAYCGITLIPPESLVFLKKIMVEANLKLHLEEFKLLIEKINLAIEQNKWMIHYGI